MLPILAAPCLVAATFFLFATQFLFAAQGNAQSDKHSGDGEKPTAEIKAPPDAKAPPVEVDSPARSSKPKPAEPPKPAPKASPQPESQQPESSKQESPQGGTKTPAKETAASPPRQDKGTTTPAEKTTRAPKPAPTKSAAPARQKPRRAQSPAKNVTPAPIKLESKPADAKPELSAAEKRLQSLKAQISAALGRKPLRAAELESICTAWQPAKLYVLDPLLDARLRLCAARASFLGERLDQAARRLDKALLATQSSADEVARRLEAEALLLRVELSLRRSGMIDRCGARLGLRGLVHWEAAERGRQSDTIIQDLKEVVLLDLEPWSARALALIAKHSDALYRSVVENDPKTFRGLPLPPPLRVEEIDATTLLLPSVGPKSAWPQEIARLYTVAESALKKAGDDAGASEAAHAKAALASLAIPPSTVLKNPLLANAPAGAIRYAPALAKDATSRFEQLQNGAFVPISAKEAIAALKIQVREKQVRESMPVAGDDQAAARPTFLAAWAGVALAESGEPVPMALLLPGLTDPRPQLRFLILRTVEVSPVAQAYKPVVDHFARLLKKKPWDKDGYDLRFKTLSAALFGEEERALLALGAVIDKERSLLTKVTYEDGLPRDERTFLIAEQGDSRARYRVQELITVGDDRAGAIALYAFHRTQGRRSTWLLRQHQHRAGRMGCVSKALLRFELQKGERISLDPGVR